MRIGWMVIVGLLLVAATSGATKPCPESVCYPRTTFDKPACERAATWIAVGRIVKVVDHPMGEPLFKNFAEFTVEIDRWEKGKPASPPKRIAFRVGWCKNGRTLPEDPKELKAPMRFYGAGSPTAAEPEYLWFAPVSE